MKEIWGLIVVYVSVHVCVCDRPIEGKRRESKQRHKGQKRRLRIEERGRDTCITGKKKEKGGQRRKSRTKNTEKRETKKKERKKERK